MNLSPLLVEAFERQGYETTHWSRVDPGAPDRDILDRIPDHLEDFREASGAIEAHAGGGLGIADEDDAADVVAEGEFLATLPRSCSL